MRTIDQLLEFDNQIYKVIEKNQALIFRFNKDSKIPKISNVLINFIIKTNFIKEGIFELYKSDNLYSINILCRSLIEHFLRFEYIFLRVLKEKIDDIGEEYLKLCALNEDIDIGKAWKFVGEMIGKNTDSAPYDILKEINSNNEKYSKDEIKNSTNHFRYRDIIRYINQNINKDLKYEDNSFILNIIPNYSELSSFVHGGPNADKVMMKYINKKSRDEELLNKIDLAFMITASIKLHSFLVFCQFDKKFSKGYLEIDKIIKTQNTIY